MGTLPKLVNAFFPNFVDIMGGQANPMYVAADQGDGGMGPFSSLVLATQNMSCAGIFAGVI